VALLWGMIVIKVLAMDNLELSVVSSMRVSSPFVALSFTTFAYASIGPVADLHIVNQVISPDGFSRSCVIYHDGKPLC
jgi:hypothetical protein